MRVTVAQKVQQLQERLHMLRGVSQSRHTVFVDDKDELRGFSAEKHFDTPSELLDRSFNRPREEQLRGQSSASGIVDARMEARLNRYCSLARAAVLLQRASSFCFLEFKTAQIPAAQ